MPACSVRRKRKNKTAPSGLVDTQINCCRELCLVYLVQIPVHTDFLQRTTRCKQKVIHMNSNSLFGEFLALSSWIKFWWQAHNGAGLKGGKFHLRSHWMNLTNWTVFICPKNLMYLLQISCKLASNRCVCVSNCSLRLNSERTRSSSSFTKSSRRNVMACCKWLNTWTCYLFTLFLATMIPCANHGRDFLQVLTLNWNDEWLSLFIHEDLG